MAAPFKLMIAGGGTGGHVFPGVAVADALARRVRDLDVLWVGTSRGIENKILPTTPWRFEAMELSGLNGVRGRALRDAVAKLPRAGWRAVELVRRERPHAALGVGGYAGGPLIAVAAALGVPTAVLEPNAIPGLTNRLLAPFVRRAFVTHEVTLRSFPAGVATVTGSPVRRGFLRRMGSPVPDDDPPSVLVIGGSQGARAINDVVPDAVASLARGGLRVRLTHQTGGGARDAVAARYAELGVEAEVVGFIEDVAAVMERASLVVCRAGAMTLAEIGVLGRPAIYVPLPTAADDHQRRNAEAMTERGAARWIAQSELSAEGLAREMRALLTDHNRLRDMGIKAWETAHPDAAGTIADALLDLASWPRS